MATNDPSKTMFGISPFKLNDEESEKETEPGPGGSAASAAVAREAEQAARRSLFFDEDGWDVPEERITGNYPAAGAAPLDTPDLAAAIGLAEPVEPARPLSGSGTMRFRADQLNLPDEPTDSAPPAQTDESPRPFSGTMMFSAHNIAQALSGAEEEAQPAPAESTASTVSDTAQMRGLRDDEVDEAPVPVESRPFTGTMRLRPIDLMAMEEGHKATQEVDLSFLASTTGAHTATDDPERAKAGAGQAPTAGTPPASGSVHRQPQWATMPVGAVIEPDEEVPVATGAHSALNTDEVTAAAPEPPAVNASDIATNAPSEPVADTTDSATPIGGAPTVDDDADSSDGADVSTTRNEHAPPTELTAPPVNDEPAAQPPDAESRRPAVTQPTQLMPALTLPPSIAGERDQVLDHLVSPTTTAGSGGPDPETGPSPLLILVFIVAAVLVLALAAYFVLR